ncbi:TetR/AcrR family transcriptional regulator [Corynebacterium alimapuense]|uniref:TetR/AcrR family transcriptional regulator n=1 Tax=Corynebacterium alimapuense TaxID=1576874 RepID=UPI001FECE4A1|nr:TetR/AcrR family transcriptional regulator [Corynebacterium alimapuense]
MSTRKRLSTTERRAVILEAARSHFSAAAYPEVSVAAIAKDSGSSQALVFHYFASKAGLQATVVSESLAQLRQAQLLADSALSPGTSARDRIRTLLLTHLEHLAADPNLIPRTGEPATTHQIRDQARSDLVDWLSELLAVTDFSRHTWALWGWAGFLELVARRWAEAGCPADERFPLIDAALGALEGALGDWSTTPQWPQA